MIGSDDWFRLCPSLFLFRSFWSICSSKFDMHLKCMCECVGVPWGPAIKIILHEIRILDIQKIFRRYIRRLFRFIICFVDIGNLKNHSKKEVRQVTNKNISHKFMRKKYLKNIFHFLIPWKQTQNCRNFKHKSYKIISK